MGSRFTQRQRSAIGTLLILLPAAAMAARLEISSTPAGGTVFLDDRYLGTTPLDIEIDAEGRHLLRIEKRGSTPWRGSVDLGPEPLQLQIELSPQALGQISVITEPSLADVYVDGRLLGKSPVVAADVSLGFHRVQIA